jgi:hypothetical protein
MLEGAHLPGTCRGRDRRRLLNVLERTSSGSAEDAAAVAVLTRMIEDLDFPVRVASRRRCARATASR